MTPSAATQMDQEIVTLSKVRQTKINIITYMRNLNKNICTNKLRLQKRNRVTDAAKETMVIRRERKGINDGIRTVHTHYYI